MLKNVTLSAEERLIQKAREKARRTNRTLNAAFREWLASYTGDTSRAQSYVDLMAELGYVSSGRKLSRDELNER